MRVGVALQPSRRERWLILGPPDDEGWCSRKPTITRVLRQIAGQYWQKSELFSSKKVCHHKKMSTFAKNIPVA